ncbi:MAG: radical SAM protein [Atopobiaceae bacterium]|nr:radical SAM protein [Atopobiaceae bacterium]
MHKVRHAYVTLTTTCNLRCSWCYFSSGLGTKNMECGTLSDIALVLQDLGVSSVTLIGGEPALYPDFNSVLSLLSGMNLHVGVATNGIAFANRAFAAACVDAGLGSANVSLKGLDSAEYQANTGAACFHSAMHGISNLSVLGVPTVLSYVVCSDDPTLGGRLSTLYSLSGADALRIQFMKPDIFSRNESIMSMSAMASVATRLYQELEGEVDTYEIEISFPFCLIDHNLLSEMLEHHRICNGCMLHRHSGISFDIDGSLLPCNHFVGTPYQRRDGNRIDLQYVKAVLEGGIARQVRETSLRFPSKRCAGCKHWLICGGGCMTRWFKEDPSLVIPNNDKAGNCGLKEV